MRCVPVFTQNTHGSFLRSHSCRSGAERGGHLGSGNGHLDSSEVATKAKPRSGKEPLGEGGGEALVGPHRRRASHQRSEIQREYRTSAEPNSLMLMSGGRDGRRRKPRGLSVPRENHRKTVATRTAGARADRDQSGKLETNPKDRVAQHGSLGGGRWASRNTSESGPYLLSPSKSIPSGSQMKAITADPSRTPHRQVCTHTGRHGLAYDHLSQTRKHRVVE